MVVGLSSTFKERPESAQGVWVLHRTFLIRSAVAIRREQAQHNTTSNLYDIHEALYGICICKCGLEGRGPFADEGASDFGDSVGERELEFWRQQLSDVGAANVRGFLNFSNANDLGERVRRRRRSLDVPT